jgi:uracil-DNA glycosylase, family 4
MDNAIRLQYLQAMGIDVWVSRHQPIATQTSEEFSTHAEYLECAEPSEAHDDNLTASDNLATIESSVHWPSHDSAQPALQHGNDHAWRDLQQEVSLCHACELCKTRTQTVFGVGSHHASWMLIGEAPGQHEDLQGEPFVGRAGQLLNEMLRAIGLQREQVFIANILKCRPPNNRDPQAEEVVACHHFLQRQIALLQPKIILAVGRIAAQNLLKTQQPLAKLRGQRHHLENIPLVVVHHPAYLLRSLTEKAKAWDDLQFAWSVYQSLQQQQE